MATVLFVVKATIRPDQEEAFNRWYNEENVPQFLQWPGAVRAPRYKALEGARRHRPRAPAQRSAARVGGRPHPADVRPLGLLRRRDALRVLSAPREGARPLDPARDGRSGPCAQGGGDAPAPAVRA